MNALTKLANWSEILQAAGYEVDCSTDDTGIHEFVILSAKKDNIQYHVSVITTSARTCFAHISKFDPTELNFSTTYKMNEFNSIMDNLNNQTIWAAEELANCN
jgi:hypothetical protein